MYNFSHQIQPLFDIQCQATGMMPYFSRSMNSFGICHFKLSAHIPVYIKNLNIFSFLFLIFLIFNFFTHNVKKMKIKKIVTIRCSIILLRNTFLQQVPDLVYPMQSLQESVYMINIYLGSSSHKQTTHHFTVTFIQMYISSDHHLLQSLDSQFYTNSK